jgi:hypothetical protein
MDLVERLPVGVADDKAGVGSFEAAFLFPFEAELDAVMAPAQAFGEGWWLSPV